MLIESLKTPLGELVLGVDSSGVSLCTFSEYFGGVIAGADTDAEIDGTAHEHQRGCSCCRKSLDVMKAAKGAVRDYFRGQQDALQRVSIAPSGTDFQADVWSALRKIKYGKTKSYGQIAAAIKRPKAVRAVGTACGANPVILFIPCHRVVATNGGLGGFSAGLERKEYLLDLERSS